MNLKVCEDVAVSLTRMVCKDPGCGCDPQASLIGCFQAIERDPVDGFNEGLKTFRLNMKEGLLSQGSFEFGMMLGIAIAAASDTPALTEASRTARDLIEEMRNKYDGH